MPGTRGERSQDFFGLERNEKLLPHVGLGLERQEHIRPRRTSSDTGGVFVLRSGGMKMPVWLEILIDVLGFVGFILIGRYGRSARRRPDKPVPR